MSTNFLRNTVLACAALFVVGLVPAGLHATSHHIAAAAGPGGGGGNDPVPCQGSDCVVRAL